ncbi:Phosphatidylserine decarboxylase [Acidisarcina polymorpha]|uniref:Phosphatidylserine decarboxylase proenzyme n=1 Tax=Acidisarcina polymorpha TaxID=2211140 RepID=A0A2Z5G8F2_9BACT|nr:phosphatidylserine decarboxylase family protein [Acidisarcina polymorpha]AXC14826.1 Phosphatidylserine decarboxylase [Acidisarcina polymorpha]
MVRDGYFYGFGLLAVAGALIWWTGGWLWAIVPLLLAAFFLWFFRDPARRIPSGAGLIVSPADGVVTSVEHVSTLSGKQIKLSVFLSVFDVHVNRSPLSGLVREVRYEKGLFLNAMNPASADKNEQNTVVVEGDGCQIVFKQIAGLLARRIVFNKRVGDRVERGERVGLIKFGSRVDVLLPGNAAVSVKKGDRVRGGASVLAKVPVPTPLSGEPMIAGERRI